MDRSVSAARKIAEQVRYSADTLRDQLTSDLFDSLSILRNVYQNDLHISSSVTPGLSHQLDEVCKRLRLPENAVHAFIYASPHVQAECYPSSDDSCILRFSSALVDLLNEDEFGFVAGHEVGHFLLKHGLEGTGGSRSSVEYLIQHRAQEISVDRIGLLACRSLDVAIRAMMKTVSGLADEHLRFDVRAFLRQLDLTPSGSEVSSTHPSIFVRCRALLWFSLSEAFNRGASEYINTELVRLDARVKRDVDRYVDGPARQLLHEATDDLLLWTIAYHVVQDGVFDKHEQQAVGSVFGENILSRLKEFLTDIPSSDASKLIFRRLVAARENLEHLMPLSFEEARRAVEQRALDALGQKANSE